MTAKVDTQEPTASPGHGTTPEPAALSHLLFPSAFLALGSVLVGLTLVTARFPGLFAGMFSYGRMEMMASIAIVVGWLIPAGSGIIYYLLPRLTAAPLANQALAKLGGPASSIVALVGMVTVGLGFGDGLAPLGLPWWIDLGVLAVSTIPLLVTISTLQTRSEKGTFVSMWYITAAVVWLPMLYVAANLPGFLPIGRVLQETVFLAGLSSAWVLAIGIGAASYLAVKITGNPLTNRSMGRLGFWSLAFGAIWAGPGRLVLGTTPDWLDTVAATLGLAVPVAVIAACAMVGSTIDRSWKTVKSNPSLMATMAGLGLALVVSSLAAAATFRSAAATVGFTSFWNGIDYGWLMGVGTLVFAGATFQAIPALTGRQVPNSAARGIGLAAVGALGVVASSTLSGLLTGFAWSSAAFSNGSYIDGTDGWISGLGPANVFSGLAILFGLVAMAGQVSIAYSIVSTITSGKVGAQEVIVSEDVS